MATKAKTNKAASKKVKATKVKPVAAQPEVVAVPVEVATTPPAETRAPTRKRNKSGFPGVYFSNRRQKFRATIKVNGKRVRLGSFATAEEASAAYEKAAAQ